MDTVWRRGLTAAMLLSGRVRAGMALLADEDDRWLAPLPEELAAEAERLEALGEERRAQALEMLAELLWARGHVADGAPRTALRLYRRALAATRGIVPGGAPALRVELAAAALLAGREEEAAETLEGLAFDPLVHGELPRWAREALEEARLYAPGA